MCRCPGKFFAEAEVALIAVLLLSRYRAEISGTDSTCDSGRGATCSGNTRDGPCLVDKQQEYKGSRKPHGERNGAYLLSAGARSGSFREGSVNALSASSCTEDAQTPAYLGSAVPWHSKAEPPESFAVSAVTRYIRKWCCQKDNQEGSSGPVRGPGSLPLPELRRQVGVRWPQHDVLITLSD